MKLEERAMVKHLPKREKERGDASDKPQEGFLQANHLMCGESSKVRANSAIGEIRKVRAALQILNAKSSA